MNVDRVVSEDLAENGRPRGDRLHIEQVLPGIPASGIMPDGLENRGRQVDRADR